MRERMVGEFMWSEPQGDTPDWRVWRGSAELSIASAQVPPKADLCRYIQAFVCWKPDLPAKAN